ncbi:hypothetical protein Tco_0830370 [Tanacetum coccineum]
MKAMMAWRCHACDDLVKDYKCVLWAAKYILLPASESEPDNEIVVENPIEHEDEIVPVSVSEVGESSTPAIPREDGDRLLPGFMRRDIDSILKMTEVLLLHLREEGKNRRLDHI